MSTSDPHADAPVLHHGPRVETAAAVLICLHGRSATADDALALGRAVAPPETALLAPQAHGSSWYPRSFLAPIESNQPYLDSALALLSRIVHGVREAGVSRSRTMLVGFSQGACLACEFIARNPSAASRASILTGGLIGQHLDADHYPLTDNAAIIHLTTGVPDPHVPQERVLASVRLLESRGHQVTTALYPGRAHSVSTEEVKDSQELFRSANLPQQ